MEDRTQDVARRAARALAENLRERRRVLGLSLEQLSRLSGVSRGMLGKIERQQSSPTLDVLGRISPALGLEVPTLLIPARPPATSAAALEPVDDSG